MTGMSAFELAGVQIRKGLLVLLGAGILSGFIAGLYPIFSTEKSTARAVLSPDQPDQETGGFNAVLGSLTGSSNASGFLKAILQSHLILHEAVRKKVNYKGKNAPLGYHIFSVEEKKTDSNVLPGDTALWIQALKSRLTVFTDLDGLVIVEYISREGDLAGKTVETLLSIADSLGKARKGSAALTKLQFLEHRVDSLEKELKNTDSGIAGLSDTRKFNIKATETVNQSQLTRKRQLLNQLYIDASLMKQEALVEVQEQTPSLQIIDPPMPPYSVSKPSFVVYFIIGAVVGIFCTLIFLVRKQLPYMLGWK